MTNKGKPNGYLSDYLNTTMLSLTIQNLFSGIRVHCNPIIVLGVAISLSGLMSLQAADDLHGSANSHTHGSQDNESYGLEHEFNAPPSDQVSLNTDLDVSVENSILDNDIRLKNRLDNALDSQSESELIKFIDMEIGDQYKRKLLLTLGEVYERQGSPSRVIALYEKFIIVFPRDKELPKLFLKLGRMYRDSGATKTALAKFYNVLNVALNVPVDELKDYQDVSHRAQLEIADTFFSMGSYDKAAKFFKRLLRIDLVSQDHQNILFKYAYTIYLSGNYSESVAGLRSFINEFPQSDLAPEARYLLSETYIRLNDPRMAMKETLELLNSEISKIDTNPEAWLYWKKRTGNKLANQFYQDANYMDALTIYRAMVDLSLDPVWTWPVLYQVGLCYEKLNMKPKAQEAYQQIVDTNSSLTDEMKDDPTLSSISEMAVWRVERLELDLDMQFNLNSILDNG